MSVWWTPSGGGDEAAVLRELNQPSLASRGKRGAHLSSFFAPYQLT